MNHFFDIHQHVLFGVDDGPAVFEDMADLLKMDAADGITTLIATPHATPGMKPVDTEKTEEVLLRAQSYCQEQQWMIKILSGAEVLYTPAMSNCIQGQKIPVMGNTNLVLLEFLPVISYREMTSALHMLTAGGYRPILAHIERYQCLSRHPFRALELKNHLDVYLQVNCGTLLRNNGLMVNHMVKKLLAEEAVDFVATDAHSVWPRPPQMTKAYEALKNMVSTAYANRLTGETARQLFHTERKDVFNAE